MLIIQYSTVVTIFTAAVHDRSFYYDVTQHALQHYELCLVVTIVEIHMPVLDVCVCLNSIRVQIFICITVDLN